MSFLSLNTTSSRESGITGGIDWSAVCEEGVELFDWFRKQGLAATTTTTATRTPASGNYSTLMILLLHCHWLLYTKGGSINKKCTPDNRYCSISNNIDKRPIRQYFQQRSSLWCRDNLLVLGNLHDISIIPTSTVCMDSSKVNVVYM
jgi:hypothetical protein